MCPCRLIHNQRCDCNQGGKIRRPATKSICGGSVPVVMMATAQVPTAKPVFALATPFVHRPCITSLALLDRSSWCVFFVYCSICREGIVFQSPKFILTAGVRLPFKSYGHCRVLSAELQYLLLATSLTADQCHFMCGSSFQERLKPYCCHPVTSRKCHLLSQAGSAAGQTMVSW